MAFSLDRLKERAAQSLRLTRDIAAVSAVSIIRSIADVVEAITMKHIAIVLAMLAIGVWSFVIGGMMQFIRVDGTIVPSNYREEGCAEVKLEGEYLRCEVRYRKEQEVKVFLGKE